VSGYRFYIKYSRSDAPKIHLGATGKSIVASFFRLDFQITFTYQNNLSILITNCNVTDRAYNLLKGGTKE
jgi:hypothetical protein